jgi:DNA modification methylase
LRWSKNGNIRHNTCWNDIRYKWETKRKTPKKTSEIIAIRTNGFNEDFLNKHKRPIREDIITKHSNEGDTVLDTFLGSGTTAVACANTNRNFKGCELNKEYCQQMVDKLGLNIDLEEDTEFIIEEDE